MEMWQDRTVRNPKEAEKTSDKKSHLFMIKVKKKIQETRLEEPPPETPRLRDTPKVLAPRSEPDLLFNTVLEALGRASRKVTKISKFERRSKLSLFAGGRILCIENQ